MLSVAGKRMPGFAGCPGVFLVPKELGSLLYLYARLNTPSDIAIVIVEEQHLCL